MGTQLKPQMWGRLHCPGIPPHSHREPQRTTLPSKMARLVGESHVMVGASWVDLRWKGFSLKLKKSLCSLKLLNLHSNSPLSSFRTPTNAKWEKCCCKDGSLVRNSLSFGKGLCFSSGIYRSLILVWNALTACIISPGSLQLPSKCLSRGDVCKNGQLDDSSWVFQLWLIVSLAFQECGSFRKKAQKTSQAPFREVAISICCAPPNRCTLCHILQLIALNVCDNKCHNTHHSFQKILELWVFRLGHKWLLINDAVETDKAGVIISFKPNETLLFARHAGHAISAHTCKTRPADALFL